jgi:hypothetical protein
VLVIAVRSEISDRDSVNGGQAVSATSLPRQRSASNCQPIRSRHVDINAKSAVKVSSQPKTGNFAEKTLKIRFIITFYWLGQFLQTLYFWKAYDM